MLLDLHNKHPGITHSDGTQRDGIRHKGTQHKGTQRDDGSNDTVTNSTILDRDSIVFNSTVGSGGVIYHIATCHNDGHPVWGWSAWACRRA